MAEFSQECNVDSLLLLAVPHHGSTTYPSRAGTMFPALAGKAFIHSPVTPEGLLPNDRGLCLNAPGYIDLVESYTKEIMTRYPLDAIRYDILFSPKECLCDGCKAYYKKLYGEELTTWNGIGERRVLHWFSNAFIV